MSERETMEVDLLIVGAGPAGLSTAIKAMQVAQAHDQEISVCVLEKGSEVGAHILSGAIFETRALDELIPDWKERGAPLETRVQEDQMYLLRDAEKAWSIPTPLIPSSMHNHGNYIISVGNLCRWLAEQAEALGVALFPGFPASEILYHEDGSVKGVATQDMGVDKRGQPKDSFTQGIELHAKYTVFAEGCRGHLGKQLIDRFDLAKDADPQHYGLGFKELWEVPKEQHEPGRVIHGSGWPLSAETQGGFFLYHAENQQVVVGLIVDLNYSNPYLSPFDEFQRMKHHPVIASVLKGGTRLSYGARAIAKGGLNALPRMVFPGGLLIGCDAGTLNFAKIKGTHTAMKSGVLAGEVVATALINGSEGGARLTAFETAFRESWLYQELYQARNFGPALHRFGMWGGGLFNYLDQSWFKGRLPVTLHDLKPDYTQLLPASQSNKIDYPKPDGLLSFDKLSSVYLSNTNHEEDQPCHLHLKDQEIPIRKNLPVYAEPAVRYCPAGVYEIVEEGGHDRLQINAQNCLHCKTCDIKDPYQNINWVTPEGSGGPNYPNM
jgi:electron-transferring-flavoprotein dehydrogenase